MTRTIPTTLNEYQEFVRKEALKVQLDMGWPDEKLNATLRALGLPEKLNFFVPVEVTGKTVAIINIADATSEEEAQAKIAAYTDDELRVAVQNVVSTGNFTQLAGKVTTIPETFAVGDPDLTLANSGVTNSLRLNGADQNARRACETYGNAGYYCTLRRGHGGDQHVAGNGVTIKAVWPVES